MWADSIPAVRNWHRPRDNRSSGMTPFGEVRQKKLARKSLVQAWGDLSGEAAELEKRDAAHLHVCFFELISNFWLFFGKL